MISKITFNKISKKKISRPPRVREIVITHPYSQSQGYNALNKLDHSNQIENNFFKI